MDRLMNVSGDLVVQDLEGLEGGLLDRLTSAVVGPCDVLVIACGAPGHAEPRPGREITTNSAPKAGAECCHG
jgi:hypothetical protein